MLDIVVHAAIALLFLIYGARTSRQAIWTGILHWGPQFLVVLADAEARRLARIGLANYFAVALVLPYADFLAAAEAERYDIERLGRRFGVSFENRITSSFPDRRRDARSMTRRRRLVLLL